MKRLFCIILTVLMLLSLVPAALASEEIGEAEEFEEVEEIAETTEEPVGEPTAPPAEEPAEEASEEPAIEAPAADGATAYDLYICGEQVTSANRTGPGWSYDHASRTLTLNNADLTETHGVDSHYAVILADMDLTIRLIGSSRVVLDTDITYRLYGIWLVGHNLTIEGLGSLVVDVNARRGTSSCGISADRLTLDDNVSVTVSATGADKSYKTFGCEIYDLTVNGGTLTSYADNTTSALQYVTRDRNLIIADDYDPVYSISSHKDGSGAVEVDKAAFLQGAPWMSIRPDAPPPVSDPVPIDAKHFPDEEFRWYISQELDADGDGVLSPDEIAGVKTIECYGRDICFLDGLRYFPALRELDCFDNDIAEVYVGDNNYLRVLDCSENGADSLYVGNCTDLTELNCSGNELDEVELVDNGNLVKFDFSDNLFRTADVSNCPKLRLLRCNGNQLTELDISQNPCLIAAVKAGPHSTAFGSIMYYLEAKTGDPVVSTVRVDGRNLQVSALLVTDPGVKLITEAAAPIESDKIPVDAAHFPDPAFRSYVSTRFDKDGSGGLSERELSASAGISCSGLGVRDLTGVELFRELGVLDVSGTQLTSLDLTGCPDLWSLSCEDCGELKSLNVSGLPRLERIDASGGGLRSIDASGCGKLEKLFARENALTSVNVSGCGKLETLEISMNALTSLDVSGCPALSELTCDENQLTRLDLSKNPRLNLLTVGGNPLESLDVRPCESLTMLQCQDCGLKSLRLGQVHPDLALLFAWGNDIAVLDLSGTPALQAAAKAGRRAAIPEIAASFPTAQDAALYYMTTNDPEQTILTLPVSESETVDIRAIALLDPGTRFGEAPETEPPAVKLSADGRTATATGFAGLYARVALVLQNGGTSGLYVTQVTINPDGTIVIPSFTVPGLKVKGVNIALVPTLADISSPQPNVRASDFKML